MLPALFQEVWVPGTVARELRHDRTPELVRQRAERLPQWVHVREIGSSAFDHESAKIDQGECEAIELAREIHANLLLMDDRCGVQTAREQGFTVTGTLGFLVEAATLGLIEIENALEKLAGTKFRRTPELFTQTAQLVRNRRHE